MSEVWQAVEYHAIGCGEGGECPVCSLFDRLLVDPRRGRWEAEERAFRAEAEFRRQNEIMQSEERKDAL